MNDIVHSITYGRVRCDIERREGAHGVFYSSRFFRWFKKDDGFEKAHTFATSERSDDLEDLVRAATDANNWIRIQMSAQHVEQPNG